MLSVALLNFSSSSDESDDRSNVRDNKKKLRSEYSPLNLNEKR